MGAEEEGKGRVGARRGCEGGEDGEFCGGGKGHGVRVGVGVGRIIRWVEGGFRRRSGIAQCIRFSELEIWDSVSCPRTDVELIRHCPEQPGKKIA